MKIIAYLDPSSGLSVDIRALMKKYGLEYEDRDIVNDPDQHAEMVKKSGQSMAPCIDIDGYLLAAASAKELGDYLLSKGLVSPHTFAPESLTHTPCCNQADEAMHSTTVRFF